MSSIKVCEVDTGYFGSDIAETLHPLERIDFFFLKRLFRRNKTNSEQRIKRLLVMVLGDAVEFKFPEYYLFIQSEIRLIPKSHQSLFFLDSERSIGEAPVHHLVRVEQICLLRRIIPLLGVKLLAFTI
jgi:hypothetical protein